MQSRTAVIVAGAANLAIAIVKLVAAAITGSASMLSEGLRSIVDTLDQALLLLGLQLSKRPCASSSRAPRPFTASAPYSRCSSAPIRSS